MSTIDSVVQRAMRDYLQPPDDMPPHAKLQGAMTDVQVTLVYSDELMPEEESAITAGTVVEVEYELMRVTAISESTRTLTVSRESFGTSAAAHPITALVRFSPKITWTSVYEAVADEVVGLYPELYAVGSAALDPMLMVQELGDPNAVSVLSARQLVAGHYEPVWAEIVRGIDEVSDDPVVQYLSASNTQDVYLRYSKAFSRPTSPSDTFASLGLSEHWQRLLIFGAMSSLLVSIDVDAATQEFITEALEAQGFPVGSGSELGITFARLRATAMLEARNELKAVNKARQHMRQVI